MAYFQPSTVIYQRIVALADAADGKGNTQDTKWDLLVEKVKAIVPKTALTEQDRLRQMKKRKDESWSKFLDRYSVYAHTCAQVEDRQKIAELYRKLPREIRNMLVFMPADISFDDMLKNMAHIRYWQSCTNEANSLANPMDIDCV